MATVSLSIVGASNDRSVTVQYANGKSGRGRRRRVVKVEGEEEERFLIERRRTRQAHTERESTTHAFPREPPSTETEVYAGFDLGKRTRILSIRLVVYMIDLHDVLRKEERICRGHLDRITHAVLSVRSRVRMARNMSALMCLSSARRTVLSCRLLKSCDLNNAGCLSGSVEDAGNPSRQTTWQVKSRSSNDVRHD